MNWFSRKKRDSNLEPMQGQSREEANSGLDEAQRAREQLALESMRSLTESLRRMKSAEAGQNTVRSSGSAELWQVKRAHLPQPRRPLSD